MTRSPIELSWTAKKSGIKKCLEIMPIKKGKGGAEKTILNFHFDYWNPSLRYVYWKHSAIHADVCLTDVNPLHNVPVIKVALNRISTDQS